MHKIKTVILSCLSLCILSSCFDTTKDHKYINLRDYDNYTDFVDSFINVYCQNQEATVYIKSIKNLIPYDYCDTDLVFRHTNPFSFSDSELSRAHINQSDEQIEKLLTEYIINPRKQDNHAYSPQKANVLIKFDEDLDPKIVLKYLKRLDNIYTSIKEDYQLAFPLRIRFHQYNVIPLPSKSIRVEDIK